MSGIHVLGQYHGCWCPGSWCRQAISSHGIDFARQKHEVDHCLQCERISTTCIISAYRNHRKCKYTYIIYVALEQNLAKGSLQEMLASTQTALQRVVAHHSCPVGGFSHFWLQQGEPGDCGNTQDSSSLYCRSKSGVLNIMGTCKTSFLNSEMVQHCRWMKFFPMEGKDQPISYDGWCPENSKESRHQQQ